MKSFPDLEIKRKSQTYVVFLIFLITLSVFIIKYQGYGIGDMNEHMVLVQNQADSSVFLEDWFVDSASDFNIRRNFGIIVNSLNSIIGSYEITALILLFLTTLIFSIGFYKILLLLTGSYPLSLFGVIFATGINHPVIGAHPFEMGTILISSITAFALIIWALYFFMKKSYFISFLILGASSLIHISHAYLAYGLFIFALTFREFNFRDRDYKKYIRKIFPEMLKSLSFFILFLASLMPLITSKLNESVLSSQELIYLFKFRAPWHYTLFSSWGLPDFIFFVILIGLFIFALLKSEINKDNKRVFWLFTIAVIAYYLLELTFTTLIPIGIVAKLHFFRISTFFDVIISLAVISWLYPKLSEFKRNFETRTSEVSLALFTALLILVTWNILFYLGSNSEILFSISNKMPLISLAAGLIFIILFKNRKVRILVFAAILLVLSFSLISNPLIGRYSYDPETSGLYDYIKHNTPKDSVLLVPPGSSSFRIGTKRAIVVDHKAFPYHEQGMLEWYDRILDITNSQDLRYKKGIVYKRDLEDKYEQLTEEEIILLKEKYNFSYAIFEDNRDLNFEKFFQNERFIVYEIG